MLVHNAECDETIKMLLKTYLFASTNDGDTIGSMIKRRVKKNWPRWKSGPQPKLTAYEKVKYL